MTAQLAASIKAFLGTSKAFAAESAIAEEHVIFQIIVNMIQIGWDD